MISDTLIILLSPCSLVQFQTGSDALQSFLYSFLPFHVPSSILFCFMSICTTFLRLNFCLPRLLFPFTDVSFALLAPLSGSLLITSPSHVNRLSLTFSLMFTIPANFLMSSSLLCSYSEILHIFLNILLSVASSLVLSALLMLLTLFCTTIRV